MALVMNKGSAVLQGSFLLADKLCLPSSLSSLQKADWTRVGRPVLEAVTEICGHLSSKPSVSWMKTFVGSLWLKVLSSETGSDVETSWRDDPFFSLHNGLPEVNRVVLLEVVKLTASAPTFARLLLYLPQSQICAELEKLVQFVRSSPTGEDDVRLLLEVWWELWKGRDEQRTEGEDSVETMFARQFSRLLSSSVSCQAAKRLKLDPSDLPSPDVLHILLQALRDLKDHISAELCFQALSVSLDALYTTFLIDRAVELPTEEKLHILSKVVSMGGKSDESPERIQEAQRDVRASNTPSQFQPSRMKLSDALKIVTELGEFWLNGGLLKACDGSNHSYSAFKLEQSIQRVLRSETDMDDQERDKLRGLLASLALSATESTAEVNAKVAATIIAHRLEDYQRFAVLFASEQSWAACGELWMDCLQQNQAAFQQSAALTGLTSTLLSELHSRSAAVSHSRKLMKVTTDVFSALSLKDKNEALATMLRLSRRGFFGRPVPSAVTEGFEQELNMAFNCIIQGGGEHNLNTAASLVARIAFQNPEAALRSCCHAAVFNKGAFSLMAKILQQLPGLRGGSDPRDEDRNTAAEEGRDAGSGGALLCRCLQEVMKSKSLSANESEQLLKFLVLLMTPVEADGEDEERKRSFLTPQEVVNVFVLPNLSATAQSSSGPGPGPGLGLALQLLQASLSVKLQDPDSPHWLMSCSPFPLLLLLVQLLQQTLRCWEPVPRCSLDTKDQLVALLASLAQVVGAEVASSPSSWSRAQFWLYSRTEELDWTVRLHLKPVWRQHFKNEVPSSLLTVCDLPEQDWTGLDLPQYGQGTGLLAWMECCSISDVLCSTMLSRLSLDRRRPDQVSMFSKGLLVALSQTLPWCSPSQWTRLLGVLRTLVASGRLHVPFSLEYVDFLPLLDLRRFSGELRLSVLLLRVLQLLCGSSCSGWLPPDGWTHLSRLYALAVREVMTSLRAKLSLSPPAVSTSLRTPASRDSEPQTSRDVQRQADDCPLGSQSKTEEEEKDEEEEAAATPGQEVLFVLSQLFCHVQHVQVMMPGAPSEPLFLSSLELLSLYGGVMSSFPGSSSPLQSEDTRHFFSSITSNLEDEEMKAVLQQKISLLV